jgi:predicted Zn-dependent protease
MATGIAVGIASAALGIGQGGAQLADMVAQVTFTLPNSRLHEQEADRIGVELAARAGYDPRAAVSVWQKMAQAGGGSPPQFLSTHPSPENRIKDLEVYAAKVMPLYEAAARKRG